MEEGHGDPMRKDGKRLPLSSYSKALPQFLFSVGVLLPLCVGILIPSAAVCTLLKPLYSRKQIDSSDVKATKSDIPANVKEAIASKKSGRVFDVVVFGATGFTGKMAALYLARTYGSSVRWAIAGRRQAALDDVKKECLAVWGKSLHPHAAGGATAATLETIVADSADEAALRAACARTKAVVSTAGPFAKVGSLLVRVCAETGTHYCDITGEADWVRQMIDLHDDTARATGARIVHFCGHDCVPWDLITQQCANRLNAKGEAMKEIRIFDEIMSNPSGGTMATINHALATKAPNTSLLGFDPLLKTLNGSKGPEKVNVANATMMSYASMHNGGCWTGPFLMSWVNATCVRRSNVINHYTHTRGTGGGQSTPTQSNTLTYSEANVFPNFFAGVATLIGYVVLGTCLVIPPLNWLLYKYVFPAQGEGPSEKSMDKGFLKVTAYGTGSSGSKVKAVLYFPTDPGYRDTARMLVESGLALAKEVDNNNIKAPGGVWTPASCQGEVLLNRLIDSGCSFFIKDN